MIDAGPGALPPAADAPDADPSVADPLVADPLVADRDAAGAPWRVALAHAPRPARAGLSALFTLDATLGGIVRSTTQPIVGQMRLTWWHDALSALDDRPAPAQPVLRALAATVIARGVSGATLAGMIDAWDLLIEEEPPAGAALDGFAAARGGVLFAAAARVIGADDARVAAAGEGWALADLSRHLSDPAAAAAAARAARDRLDVALAGRWPRALRALGLVALLARHEMDGGPAAAGFARAALFRTTGW